LCHQSITECLSEIFDDWSEKKLRIPSGKPISVEDAVNKIIKEFYR